MSLLDYQTVMDKPLTPFPLEHNAPRMLSIPKSERPDIWIRLPRHKWTKSWSNIEDPVVPLERNLRSPTRRPSVGKTIRGSFVGAWMAKSTELGRSICASETWIILIGIRGWHQNGWKRVEYGSQCGRNRWKMLVFTNENHFLTMLFGMYLTRMQTERNYFEQYKETFQ